MQGGSISPYKENALVTLNTPLIVELYIAQGVPIFPYKEGTALVYTLKLTA